MQSVPVVDLAAPDTVVAEQVHQACSTRGFFHVVNHGIDQELQDKLFEQLRLFFSLPANEKIKILADGNNRGYTPYQEETLNPSVQSVGDTKEGLYFGREVPKGDPEAETPLHGPNQWPDPAIVPLFRPTVMQYFEACTRLGFRLLDVLSDALKLQRGFFRDAFNAPMTFLRPLRYSATRSCPEQGVLGAGPHTDYGMLTLLLTDGTQGLQIQQAGAWVDVETIAGGLVVNLGDMLERWTNGMYKSTVHRVLSTSGKERFSCPFFFEPNFHTKVLCLPGCSSDNGPMHPTTTAGEYLLARYRATHAGFFDPASV